MDKIAIIYTTFLRDNLARKTLESIFTNFNDNYFLLVGDQNRESSFAESIEGFPAFKSYKLPFDCGLSYARNYLVREAQKLGCKYCLITADSIEFTEKYDFKPVIDFMESNEKIVKVGFQLNNRTPWEYNMELIPGKYWKLTLPETKGIVAKGDFTKVDICRNFFLAKTRILIGIPWDEELKLSEHEDHCWRLKLGGFDTYSTNYISANYINDKPEEYSIYRNRMYQEFRKKLKEKYGILGWISKP